MGSFVVDKSLDVLLRQINEMAPGRSKASDGSIGDAAHAARNSAHNPQDTSDSSDGNDPDNQVDARDFTHDPAHGADMHQITEQIRQSRDRRVRLVIFNGRQFSSYSTPSREAWEWGLYQGENQHTKHAHVETNDLFNDDLTLWRITVALNPEEASEIIGGKLTARNVLHYRLRAIQDSSDPILASTYPNWATSSPGLKQLGDQISELKAMLKVQAEQALALSRAVDGLGVRHDAATASLMSNLDKLKDAVDAITTTINLDDAVVVQRIVESGVRSVLREGVDQA